MYFLGTIADLTAGSAAECVRGWVMLRVLKFLYAVLIFSLPFNGLVQFLPAGELSGDGFFYASLPFNIVMMLVIAFNGMKLPGLIVRPMWHYFSFLLTIFLFATVINIGSVMTNSSGLRNGLSKFVLSYGVFLYYCMTFTFIGTLAAYLGREHFLRFTAWAFFISGIFLVSIAALEVAGWFNGAARSVLVGFRSLFASFPERVFFRISGVSYEPSFFAISMLVALPWTMLYARLNRSRFAWFIAALLIFIASASGARTALVGLIAYLLVMLIARMRNRLTPVIGAAVPAIAMVLGPLVPLYAYTMVWSYDSISDVTRSFLASRAVLVGLEHPFGVGFGQVQFYFKDMMDTSVNLSWELEGYFLGDRIGELPPVFSWYGKTLGDIGLIAYALVAIAASIASYNLYILSRRFDHHSLEAVVFRMAIGFSGIFLGIGLSSDSYRFSPFWFMFLLIGLFRSYSTQKSSISAATNTSQTVPNQK